MAVIAALECVSLVTWFEEDTPLARIVESRPEVLVKGGDWAIDKIVGATEVTGWGGTVHAIAFQHERSTTATLAKIRAAAGQRDAAVDQVSRDFWRCAFERVLD